MNEMINTLKGVVLLDDKTYQSFLASDNVMKRGIFILLACFLIVALPSSLITLADNVTPFTQERAQEFTEQFLQGFEIAEQFMPQNEGSAIFLEQFKENFAYGVRFGVEIDALPRPLPRAVGGFFQAFGGWISAPFAHLGAWLGYAIWVLLFSKMTGGFGGTKNFLGLTALYAVPNLLGFFSFIPFLGSVVAFVGVVWGWFVYTKGIVVSQEFSMGKAILVTILPVLLMFILILVLTTFTVVGLISIAGSAQ